MYQLIYYYTLWHYSTALRDLVRVSSNLVWFCIQFFSFATLTYTFFAPFHRLNEGYARGFELNAWAQTFVLNMLMRIVGVCARTVVLVIGTIVLCVVVAGATFMFCVWLLAPLLLLFLVGSSFVFLAL